jgi:hypothetical protein
MKLCNRKCRSVNVYRYWSTARTRTADLSCATHKKRQVLYVSNPFDPAGNLVYDHSAPNLQKTQSIRIIKTTWLMLCVLLLSYGARKLTERVTCGRFSVESCGTCGYHCAVKSLFDPAREAVHCETLRIALMKQFRCCAPHKKQSAFCFGSARR